MIITISGSDQDISSYFSVNEEENSNHKVEVVSEYNPVKILSTIESIQFLKKQRTFNNRYLQNYGNVLLEISSPPPRIS